MELGTIDLVFVLHILLAVGMGGLIGLEREHEEKKPRVIAGVRTFPLTSMSGVLFSFLSASVDLRFIEVGVLIFGGFSLLLAYLKYEIKTIGITTPVALFITFLIGILIQQGFILEAGFVTITVTVLLITKERLHRIARNLGR
ncbi:MAG: MgtC/SapB family protein [Candidatus Thermoplasmatota archaeon]|nr:MgtC/SapB family protein [Candidatus Thermoplasmatota archaeon]